MGPRLAVYGPIMSLWLWGTRGGKIGQSPEKNQREKRALDRKNETILGGSDSFDLLI